MSMTKTENIHDQLEFQPEHFKKAHKHHKKFRGKAVGIMLHPKSSEKPKFVLIESNANKVLVTPLENELPLDY